MKYLTTPIAFSVHLDSESPIFGEAAIHVRIEDEAGGPFIVLKSMHPGLQGPGEISLDWEQLELILEAARKLMEAQPKDGVYDRVDRDELQEGMQFAEASA